MSEPLRCLSLQQPWAWAVCTGLKPVENRSWSTNYRGLIALHASSSRRWINTIRREWDDLELDPLVFPYGAIIGTAELVDVQPIAKVHLPGAEGPLCWIFEGARLLLHSIPSHSKLQLYRLSEAETEQVRQQLDQPAPREEDQRLAAWREAIERW